MYILHSGLRCYVVIIIVIIIIISSSSSSSSTQYVQNTWEYISNKKRLLIQFEIQ